MIAKISVKKPYTVLVAVVLVIVLGVVSFTKMTTDLLPNISLPYIIVMTTYQGASPETVEMVVTKPVEASMATVSNIEEISSVSGENYSMVILEFAQSADMNACSLEIREKLDQIKSYWNDEIGNPIIMKLNPDMLPVMIAAVGGKGMSNTEISDMTNRTILPEIESIEGVASASATGMLEESVHVIIRQEKIDEINEKVFGSIDKEIDENKADLLENKQEIYDGQKELEEAKAELEESRQELLDSEQDLADSREELADSKKKLADGKAEISENKTKLEDGKKELSNKRSETTSKLAETETQLLTAKADAEAAKTHIQAQLKSLEAAETALTKAEEAVNNANNRGISSKSEAVGASSLCESVMKNPASDNDTLIASYPNDTERDSIKSLLGVADDTIMADVKNAADAVKTMLDSLVNADPWTLRDDLESSINSDTMGLGVSGYTQMMQSTISDLNGNIAKLDAGLSELYAGNMKAAIEFANAQTQISIGESQITAAESQIEASEKQIESGEDQLESGQKQIEKGWDQLESGQEQIDDNAEKLKDALQQIIDGEEELEEAREDAKDQADMHGILTVATVEQLLAAQNFSMPAGYVTEDEVSYLVRVGDKPETVEELKRMPLMNPEMDDVDVITLGDVADVFMSDNSEDIYTNVNGEPGVILSIQKQTGYSTGDVSDKIKDKFQELLDENDNLMLITLMDQGIYIDLVMDSIMNNILFGAGLAILILILFLKDLRPTAVIACSIPISIVTAIVCMYFSGVTLNVISLSGLALGIGMLVDNSIVVIENIYRMRNEGRSVVEAAIEGTREVAGAIAASTLTTVCVFLPIVFTEGITRQLFVDMGLTIAFSLIASLVVALTVVPAMASKILVHTKEKKEGRFFTAFTNVYGKILSLALRFKPVVFLLVIALLVISVLASLSKGVAFMPEMGSPQMSMTITLPKDTPLADTAQVTDEMLERISEMPDVSDVGAMITTSTVSFMLGGDDGTTNSTEAYFSLVEKPSMSNQEIADAIEEQTADLCKKTGAELEIQTSTIDMSVLGGSGITIQVRGREIDTLQKLSRDIAAIVADTEGTTNVLDGLEDSSGEMRILIDRDKAMEHGMTVAEVYQKVAVKLKEALSATKLEADTKEYDVYVEDAEDLTLTRQLLQNMILDRTDKEGKKEQVPLSEIASFQNTISPKSINRADQTRYIQVSAEIAEGYNIGLVSTEVEKKLDTYEMPSGYTLVMAGENEAIMDAMEQLILMLLLAVVFMYLIMVAQFQSLLSPFIIMFTIPLAFTGGFLGLFFSNSEVSVIAVIGFVMLAGVIVNNGIVLVDYMNQLRAQGMEKKEAILQAGKTRLRPVLMTALTTILALVTMVFGDDMGAAMSRPMAVVTIGGLTYGTLLTLIVIPCIYDVFSRVKKGTKKADDGN